MFASDPDLKQEYLKFRESYLFIVSGGGNFTFELERNLAGRLSDWLAREQIFGHAVVFTRSWLFPSEVHDFYTRLLAEMCAHHAPFREALAQAFCRDECIKAHTDLLWMTGGFPALVFRDADGARVCGLDLGSLCARTCPAKVGTVSRHAGDLHKGDRAVVLFTPCCRLMYKLSVAADAQVPEERKLAGSSYVINLWPGLFPYELDRVLLGQ
ncbi:hypothetical protein FRC12_013077 [Ceratobasidium sp. 428]|nr:hypothetical protein FRC12_013077 [Ceratobasidium sp. 428]